MIIKEEVAKYIQVGCRVKFTVDPKEYEVRDVNAGAIFVRGFLNSFGYATISKITYWPKPGYFTSEHIGHYVRQTPHSVWKQIGKNLEDCPPTSNKFTLEEANKYSIVEYRPIAPEPEPKPLLLKDCPVWSFVKLKSKEGLNTPWSQIINKSTHEIMVSQDGSEGSPDPESEVLKLIDKIEDIPEHAIVRTRNSMTYTTIKEFKGKFSDIAAIITDPAVNKNRGIHLGDLIYLDKSWHRATNLMFPSKSELTRLSDGAKVDLADSNIKYVQMIRKPEEINKDWWVKVMAGEKEPRTPTWFPASGLDLYSTGLAKILDISTTYPNKQNIDIKVGDWVKHFDFDGWQRVVACTSGISVNDGKIGHGFYSKERIIEHQRIIPISEKEFDEIEPEDSLLIAPAWFIKAHCNFLGKYKSNSYFGPTTFDKEKLYGTIIKIKNKLLEKVAATTGDFIHKDFILKVFKNTIDPSNIRNGDLIKHKDLDNKWHVVYTVTSSNEIMIIHDATKYSLSGIMQHQQVRPINEEQFKSIKSGYWVKIAPKEYIESKCDTGGFYGDFKYKDYDAKEKYYNTWVKVESISLPSRHIEIWDHSTYCFTKDFIVDISETEPQVNCPAYATKQEADAALAKGSGVAIRLDTVNGYTNPCKEIPLREPLHITYDEAFHMSWNQLNDLATRIPCYEIPFFPKEPEYESVYFPDIKVGDEIFDKEQWRMILRITTKDEKEYRALGESKTSLWTSDYSCCLVDYGSKWQIRRAKNNGLLQSNSKNKQEKIMLNTLEDIKKLNEANLKEAAEQVKESRDNDEVKAAKAKLTELLDTESKLKVSKEIIDKQLAEVQEMIKAFGYPPK